MRQPGLCRDRRAGRCHGVQQAVLRGNRAGAHTLDSAFAKAYTSASFKTDTTALVERSKTVPVLANLFKLPHLLLLSGGIAIKVGDEVVGAIGAAGAPGGDLDEACAHAGLDKIKDQLKRRSRRLSERGNRFPRPPRRTRDAGLFGAATAIYPRLGRRVRLWSKPESVTRMTG